MRRCLLQQRFHSDHNHDSNDANCLDCLVGSSSGAGNHPSRCDGMVEYRHGSVCVAGRWVITPSTGIGHHCHEHYDPGFKKTCDLIVDVKNRGDIDRIVAASRRHVMKALHVVVTSNDSSMPRVYMCVYVMHIPCLCCVTFGVCVPWWGWIESAWICKWSPVPWVSVTSFHCLSWMAHRGMFIAPNSSWFSPRSICIKWDHGVSIGRWMIWV